MTAPTPTCCHDATGGEMTRTDRGWLCVWCGREENGELPAPGIDGAIAVDKTRGAMISIGGTWTEFHDAPARPAPTSIPSAGRPVRG